MDRPYHTLCVLLDGIWSPEFGDYKLDNVVQEGLDSWPDDKCKVIHTNTDDQADIIAAIAKLNKRA